MLKTLLILLIALGVLGMFIFVSFHPNSKEDFYALLQNSTKLPNSRLEYAYVFNKNDNANLHTLNVSIKRFVLNESKEKIEINANYKQNNIKSGYYIFNNIVCVYSAGASMCFLNTKKELMLLPLFLSPKDFFISHEGFNIEKPTVNFSGEKNVAGRTSKCFIFSADVNTQNLDLLKIFSGLESPVKSQNLKMKSQICFDKEYNFITFWDINFLKENSKPLFSAKLNLKSFELGNVTEKDVALDLNFAIKLKKCTNKYISFSVLPLKNIRGALKIVPSGAKGSKEISKPINLNAFKIADFNAQINSNAPEITDLNAYFNRKFKICINEDCEELSYSWCTLSPVPKDSFFYFPSPKSEK